MRNFKNVVTVAFMLLGVTMFAQTHLSGKVVDENDQPLPGADVLVVGTTQGTSTDFDGNFSFDTKESAGSISVGFMGFETKVVSFTGATDFGTIQLVPAAQSLDEVVIVGVADIAKERQTPVAVSTMRATEIQDRIGTKELPEVLNNTPSIYATKQGGGFGDSRITIRGFDSRNTAVLINGMPVNDMENGKVYWSNWAGLADVTSAMQVQRGLGSSMLSIPSVGGSINVLTNSADKKQGGTVAATYGNDNFLKLTTAYNTGLLDNGLSMSVLLSRFSGDGYADATQGEGYTWFLSFGYKINDNNSLMFTATGAPQWHNQRYYAPKLGDYLRYGDGGADPNIKYNGDWGYLNGEVFTWRRNFYHKPIASLNWDWNINETSKINSVFYGSWGRGGGTGPIGGYTYYKDYNHDGVIDTHKEKKFYAEYYLPRTEDGLYDFDFITKLNTGQAFINHSSSYVDANNVTLPPFGTTANADGKFINARKNAGFTRRASMNSHDWYGTIIKYKNDLTDNFNVVVGFDGRMYKGYHYRVVNNTLGADAYNNTYKDPNNPDNIIYPADYVAANPSWNPFIDILGQEKIEYFSVGNVGWLGGFGQAEYKSDDFSAFMAGGVVSEKFQREDYFNYLDSDPEQISDKVGMLGYNFKGGANYNINEHHNVYFSAGYNSKPAQFGAVFPYYTNKINEDLTNEKITSYEIGYGFKNDTWKVNLNAYNTEWADRYKVASDRNTSTTGKLNGLTELHKGIELETKAKFGPVKLNGMVSLNDWSYAGDIKDVQMVDDNNDVVFTQDFYLDGVKVGNSAQFTSALGMDYEAFKGFYLHLNQFYVDKLYANIDALSFKDEDNKGSLELPAYSLVDFSATYKFTIDKIGKITTRFSVNNLFDKIYISESATNKHTKDISDFTNDDGDIDAIGYDNYIKYNTYKGVDTGNRVFFGFGRTWNLSLKYNF